jgi:hypothetical protein
MHSPSHLVLLHKFFKVLVMGKGGYDQASVAFMSLSFERSVR